MTSLQLPPTASQETPIRWPSIKNSLDQNILHLFRPPTIYIVPIHSFQSNETTETEWKQNHSDRFLSCFAELASCSIVERIIRFSGRGHVARRAVTKTLMGFSAKDHNRNRYVLRIRFLWTFRLLSGAIASRRSWYLALAEGDVLFCENYREVCVKGSGIAVGADWPRRRTGRGKFSLNFECGNIENDGGVLLKIAQGVNQ